MEKSKKINISEKRLKRAKNIFWKMLVKFENLSNLTNCVKNYYFYIGFYICLSKNHLKNNEKLDWPGTHLGPNLVQLGLNLAAQLLGTSTLIYISSDNLKIDIKPSENL